MEITEDLRLVYEYLMRDSFKCERADYDFVNADYYDNLNKHLEDAKIYVLCALINQKNKPNDNPVIDKCIKALEKNKASEELIDGILNELVESHIIF